MQRPWVENTGPLDAFVAGMMGMAVAKVFNMFRQRNLHEFISMSMRVCKRLSIAFKSPHGVVDMEADQFGVGTQVVFLPVAVSEHESYVAPAHRSDDIIAAQVAEMDELFDIMCIKQFKCSRDAVGSAV